MLQHLQDIQLGLCHDVHPTVFYTGEIHMVASAGICHFAYKMGDGGMEISGEGRIHLKNDGTRHLYIPAIDGLDEKSDWGRLSFVAVFR